jgi:hypothetical protein
VGLVIEADTDAGIAQPLYVRLDGPAINQRTEFSNPTGMARASHVPLALLYVRDDWESPDITSKDITIYIDD